MKKWASSSQGDVVGCGEDLDLTVREKLKGLQLPEIYDDVSLRLHPTCPDPSDEVFWLELPPWAHDIPDYTYHLLLESAIRSKLPLERYDPDLHSKKRGRKIVFHKLRDLMKEQYGICLKEDEHVSSQCLNLSDVVLDGDSMYRFFCETEGEHDSIKRPLVPSPPFGPSKEQPFVTCTLCRAFDHYPENCSWSPPAPLLECLKCGDNRDHWTANCPALEGQKYCSMCDSVGDHDFEDCKFENPVKDETEMMFCCYCQSKCHWTEDCPKVADDGRLYCSHCNYMGEHSTESCILADDGLIVL